MDAERAEEGAGLPALALWGFLCLLPRSQVQDHYGQLDEA